MYSIRPAHGRLRFPVDSAPGRSHEGIWVGEDSPIPNTRGYRNDVLEALKALHVPVIRWPGGCFADEYDWRDGIGPRGERPVRINTSWGWVEETVDLSGAGFGVSLPARSVSVVTLSRP